MLSMKNKYNFDSDLKNKKLKNFNISVGFEYFICCSSFLKKDKGLKFLINVNSTIESKINLWKKKVIEKSDIIMNTHYNRELSIFLGHVNLNKKDHFFILHGDEDVSWDSMPPLGYFKYVSTFKKKFNSFNCNSGKISFFSDEYVRSDFKNKKILHEFKVLRGKYSLYSINDESEDFKKNFPYSNTIGALLVKD